MVMIGGTVGMMRLMWKGMMRTMMMIGRRRRSAYSASARVLGRMISDVDDVFVNDAEAREFVPIAGQIGVSADAQLLPS